MLSKLLLASILGGLAAVIVFFVSSYDFTSSKNIPVANAGIDQIVPEGRLVTLDAGTSSDLDGDKLSYSWTQTSGPAIILSNAHGTNTTFIAPLVDSQTVLMFRLVVNDGTSNSAPDTLEVTVRDVPKPNIIVIYTDDQRWDTIDYMPNVKKRIAGEGITFMNSFVTTSLCCPSRASFLTGLYTHNHRVWSNLPPDGGAEALNDTATVATWLKAGGYSTSLIGKYLNAYNQIFPYIPPGWDDWHVFYEGAYYGYRLQENGEIRQFGNQENVYSTDLLKERALQFMRNASRPFFLWFAPFAPHPSQSEDSGAPIPAKRHLGTCDDLKPQRSPSFNEEDVSDKPRWVQQRDLMDETSISRIDEFARDQICTLKAVDESVASLMDSLGSELDNTVIIFTSDNGYSWGEHRKIGKNCIYEECVRVPLIIRYDNLVQNPRESKKFVLNIDLAPTIADLAGLTPTTKVNGRSIIPLLGYENADWRSDFLLEHLQAYHVTAVRNMQMKYVEHETGERELYDLEKDPYELNNLINDPSYAGMLESLALRLMHLKQE